MNSNSKKDLISRIKRFDWQFEYSDDFRVWKTNKEIYDKLCIELRNLSEEDIIKLIKCNEWKKETENNKAIIKTLKITLAIIQNNQSNGTN